jgi:Tfp pilus assembly protein PilF
MVDFAGLALRFGKAVEREPSNADAWHNLGTALKKLGRQAEAFISFKRALLIDPSRAGTYLNLGNLLIDAGQLDDAIECFERAAQHDGKLASARSRLAEHASQRGRVHRAESLFRQSLQLDGDHLHGWLGLGSTLEDLGDGENALACYAQALQRAPTQPLALGHYLALLRDEAAPDVLDRAAALVNDESVDDQARALVGYGLAKYYDRRRDYARAVMIGTQANAARRRVAGALDRAALSARVDALIDTYDAAFFAARRSHGVGTDQPVFIVGMPRSGTTLCEQILASHPQLHGAGELSDLSDLAVTCANAAGVQPWQAALRVAEADTRTVAAKYLRSLRLGASFDRRRISDKSPLNFFQLAFAAVLFPNARVIHCVRDPRDIALSIWFENFNPDQRYATDFDDLAFFNAQQLRLMAHWRRVLPLPILTLQYEQVVEDLESQARRLLEFLDVPWNERCLDFHRNERAVQTPSRWQVRRPIYRESVGRWRRYAPFIPQLAQGT